MARKSLLFSAAGTPAASTSTPAICNERQKPIDDVVGVVRRGEPGEVHPRPPDQEEDLEKRRQRMQSVAVRDPVRELGGDPRDRNDEREVEQQLELT